MRKNWSIFVFVLVLDLYVCNGIHLSTLFFFFFVIYTNSTRAYQIICFNNNFNITNSAITRSLTHSITNCLNVWEFFLMRIKESTYYIFIDKKNNTQINALIFMFWIYFYVVYLFWSRRKFDCNSVENSGQINSIQIANYFDFSTNYFGF